MAKRKAKKKAKKKAPEERASRLALAALREDLAARIDELAHQVEAISALPQKEGAWAVKTFARFLDVSSRTLEKMVRDGAVPHHRVGGSIRFTPADRARFLEETAILKEGEA